MEKKTKVIIGVLVAAIVAIVVFLVYRAAIAPNKKKVSVQTNTVNAVTVVEKNNVVENNTVENTVENKVETTNNVPENTVVEPPVAVIEGDNSETQADNDEDKAIEIVKKDWGNTEGFAFRVEQINANGTYVISVRNDASIALEWYTVNPNTGEFSK